MPTAPPTLTDPHNLNSTGEAKTVNVLPRDTSEPRRLSVRIQFLHALRTRHLPLTSLPLRV